MAFTHPILSQMGGEGGVHIGSASRTVVIGDSSRLFPETRERSKRWGVETYERSMCPVYPKRKDHSSKLANDPCIHDFPYPKRRNHCMNRPQYIPIPSPITPSSSVQQKRVACYDNDDIGDTQRLSAETCERSKVSPITPSSSMQQFCNMRAK